ncbi:MAG: M1 family aminopeptidase [bacterium]
MKGGESRIAAGCTAGVAAMLALAFWLGSWPRPAIDWPRTALGSPASERPEAYREEIVVRIDPPGQSLRAVGTLAIRTRGASSLRLDLAPGAAIEAVRLDGAPAPYLFRDGQLDVSIAPEARSPEIVLEVTYRASFRDPVPKDPAYTEDPGYGVKGVISDEGVLLLDAAGWYPALAGSSPVFRVTIETPAGMEAVTSGQRLSREATGAGSRSVWEIDHPVEGLALAAGRYLVRESSAGELPLYAYFYPESASLASSYLEAAGPYLRLYSERIGPYPFAKFAIVENFFPTGYGFPSFTLLGSTVIRLPFIVETSLGHEIGHSWWGNGVFVDMGQGNWSEGLTTYTADYLYKELASEQEATEFRRRILREYASLVPPDKDFPLAEFRERDSPATEAVGYGKSAMVFHMIRGLVGEEAFWRGLQAFYRENCFKRASWEDLAEAFGRQAGVDLRGFSRQWVVRKGAPMLLLEQVGSVQEGQAGGWRVTGTLRQREPLYDLRVPLRIRTERGSRDEVVRLGGSTASFSVTVKERPLSLEADPDADLFRRLDPLEIPTTVNSLRGSSSLVMVLPSGAPQGLRKAAEVLREAMGARHVDILAEDRLTSSAIDGKDLVFVGPPGNRSLLPELPARLQVFAGRFVVDGRSCGEAGDALFAVVPCGRKLDRTCGLLLARDPESAERIARKVPHYGGYSLLVFRDGRNELKETWEARDIRPGAELPLRHVFGAGL